MAKRNAREKLETWIVVSIIAALVWLYAEGAVVKEYTQQPVQIQVVGPEGGHYAIQPAETIRARVNFTCSNSQFQQFQSLTSQPLKIVIEPGNSDTTDKTLILREALPQAGLSDLGISLDEVDPPTLDVTLRDLVQVNLEVRVVTGDLSFAPNSSPVPTPAQVPITVPADVAEQLRGVGFVNARLDLALPANPNAAGEQVARDVTLEYPASLDPNNPWTEVPIRTVQINYTLVKAEETLVVRNVPIYVNLPVSLQQEYAIRPVDDAKFLLDVEIRGPTETIDRIRASMDNGETSPGIWAEIRVPDPTKIEQMKYAQPVLVAPPGVTLAEPPLPLVGVRFERRRPNSTP